MLFKAWSKSLIISSICSIPTEHLIRFSGIPNLDLSSGVFSTWLVVFDGPIMVSTDPRWAAAWENCKFEIRFEIENISLIKKNQSKITNEKFYIIIAEFYSKESANILKKRISQELTSFDRKKLYIKSKKSNKISLLSGPYNSINLMKNDYIQLKKFGFEELDISINE